MTNTPGQPLAIAAVIGSLKAASVNRAIFNATVGLMPDGIELVEASIADVPLFSKMSRQSEIQRRSSPSNPPSTPQTV